MIESIKEKFQTSINCGLGAGVSGLFAGLILTGYMRLFKKSTHYPLSLSMISSSSYATIVSIGAMAQAILEKAPPLDREKKFLLTQAFCLAAPTLLTPLIAKHIFKSPMEYGQSAIYTCATSIVFLLYLCFIDP